MYKSSTSSSTKVLFNQTVRNNLPMLKSYLISLLIHKLDKTVDALIINKHYDVMEIAARRQYVDKLKQGQLDKLPLGMAFAKNKYDIATILLSDAQGLIELEAISSPNTTDSAPKSSELPPSLASSQELTSHCISAHLNMLGGWVNINDDTDSEDSYEFTPEPEPKPVTSEEKYHINKAQSERDLQSIRAMISSRLINSKSTPLNTDTAELTFKFEKDFTIGFEDIVKPVSSYKK